MRRMPKNLDEKIKAFLQARKEALGIPDDKLDEIANEMKSFLSDIEKPEESPSLPSSPPLSQSGGGFSMIDDKFLQDIIKYKLYFSAIQSMGQSTSSGGDSLTLYMFLRELKESQERMFERLADAIRELKESREDRKSSSVFDKAIELYQLKTLISTLDSEDKKKLIEELKEIIEGLREKTIKENEMQLREKLEKQKEEIDKLKEEIHKKEIERYKEELQDMEKELEFYRDQLSRLNEKLEELKKEGKEDVVSKINEIIDNYQKLQTSLYDLASRFSGQKPDLLTRIRGLMNDIRAILKDLGLKIGEEAKTEKSKEEALKEGEEVAKEVGGGNKEKIESVSEEARTEESGGKPEEAEEVIHASSQAGGEMAERIGEEQESSGGVSSKG